MNGWHASAKTGHSRTSGNKSGGRWAMAAYPGLAPQVSLGCVCKEARFVLDGFGRLYIPNALDYRVRIVDNAGNEVVGFGYYGNADSRGQGSTVPDPDIPLGWPISVSLGRLGHVYVADTLNHRVVRVDLTPSAEAECAIK